MKKKEMLATVAVSAAIALSGVTAKAPASTPAPAETSKPGITAKVGKIVPVNMVLGSAEFSPTKAFKDECCGPYSQCKICNY